LEHVLRTLNELQDVDFELMRIKRIRGNLPQQIDELQEKLDQLTGELSTNQSEFENISKERRRCETDVKSFEEKLEKYREQIYHVKTNKEYDAITTEIESTEAEISNTETRILELMEQEDTLKKKLEIQKGQRENLAKELEEVTEELTARLEQTKVLESSLKVRRKSLVSDLSKPIYSTYERIRRGKGGIAIATVENGICTGCSSNLPPQTGLEIRKMDQIIHCQTCGRFLIWKNESPKITLNHEINPEQVG